jgi:hypothetical protein
MQQKDNSMFKFVNNVKPRKRQAWCDLEHLRIWNTCVSLGTSVADP